jgi:hypothetical protein
MKVRTSVFRYVLLNGLPWEEISIGFQARFYREPDIYEFDFWNHFQNFLPENIGSSLQFDPSGLLPKSPVAIDLQSECPEIHGITST